MNQFAVRILELLEHSDSGMMFVDSHADAMETIGDLERQQIVAIPVLVSSPNVKSEYAVVVAKTSETLDKLMTILQNAKPKQGQRPVTLTRVTH